MSDVTRYESHVRDDTPSLTNQIPRIQSCDVFDKNQVLNLFLILTPNMKKRMPTPFLGGGELYSTFLNPNLTMYWINSGRSERPETLWGKLTRLGWCSIASSHCNGGTSSAMVERYLSVCDLWGLPSSAAMCENYRIWVVGGAPDPFCNKSSSHIIPWGIVPKLRRIVIVLVHDDVMKFHNTIYRQNWDKYGRMAVAQWLNAPGRQIF